MTPPTPWSEVRRSLNGPRVAAELGLAPARARAKYACVTCDSSDALHVYSDGAKCFACGWSGSVIDLASVAWRVEPGEACRMLAERFGIRPDPTYRPEPGPVNPPEPTGPDPTVLRCKAEAYGDAVALLTLGPLGRAYLSGRGLAPELAHAHGIRSLETPGAWEALHAALAERHAPEAIEAAGLGFNGRPWTPRKWRGGVPALTLPYLSRTGQVEALRWRRIDDAPEDRYMVPPKGGACIPWRAEAVDGPHPLHIVVAEGELDALALCQAGYDAVGLGGATPSGALLAWLVDALEDVAGLALWTDADAAGDGAVDRLAALLIERYGASWVRGRVRRWRAPSDPADTLAGVAA